VVQKVNQGSGYLILKMGVVMAVTEFVLQAVKAFAYTTIGKAMNWIEGKLAAGIPLVIGFIANLVGLPEKNVLRKVLEQLT